MKTTNGENYRQIDLKTECIRETAEIQKQTGERYNSCEKASKTAK